jgi:hypothetical protein
MRAAHAVPRRLVPSAAAKLQRLAYEEDGLASSAACLDVKPLSALTLAKLPHVQQGSLVRVRVAGGMVGVRVRVGVE